MNRAEDEIEIEAAFPFEDDVVHFAHAIFDMVGHFGLSALTDQAVAFLARTIRESKRKKLGPLPPLVRAEIIQFPSSPQGE
jgi:hypothetical protein